MHLDHVDGDAHIAQIGIFVGAILLVPYDWHPCSYMEERGWCR